MELLVIIAIMAIMTTVSILSIRAGQGAARMKGAARDIFATIRQARSIALVTQQPAIISYSEREVDGEISAHVEISSTKMVSSSGPMRVETLSGESVMYGGEDDSGADDSSEDGDSNPSGGETVEEILFAPMADETVKGIRIKVTMAGEELESTDVREEKKAAKISVFSNVDYLLGRFDEAKKKSESEKQKEEETTTASPVRNDAIMQERRDVVWEVNGRCEEHRVWIYADGESPEKGLCIYVDRFGGAKILSSD